MKSKKIILFGNSAFAEIAYEYFTNDSIFEVSAFTVSEDYLKNDEFFGLPIVPFEKIHECFPPDKFQMHICVVYKRLNRVRMHFYEEAKKKGYTLASYISSRAFVWKNVVIEDNCFIFENNTELNVLF